MPLRSGNGRRTVNGNIKEMVDTWKSKGKIGNSRPRSKKKAIKQAVAITLKKADKSKYPSKKKVTIKRKNKMKMVHSQPPLKNVFSKT